jgi:hypothetical protein
MVWEEPLSKIAPRLGLSDVGLRKICVRNNIPVPQRGYWAKAASGRKSNPAPLPKPKEDWPMTFNAPEQPKEGAPGLPGIYGERIEAEKRPENRIEVQPLGDKLHPMTKALKKTLKAARPDQYGGLLCEDPAVFRVRVPEASIERALMIIEALTRAIEARGLSIQPGDTGHYTKSAGVRIGDAIVRLSLEETSTRRAHMQTEKEKAQMRRSGYSSAPLYDFVPSGLMTMSVPHNWGSGFQSSWKDTASRKLEQRLNEVMIGVYHTAHATEVRVKDEAEKARRIAAENERRAALRAERDAELAFLNTLRSDADRWREAESLRAYIAAVERHHQAQGELSPEAVVWIERSRRHADRLDPLTPTPRTALDYEDHELRHVYW